MLELVKKASHFIEQHIKEKPKIAMITGTGLGVITDGMAMDVRIPYAQIPGFPTSTTEGHRGILAAGMLAGKRVIALEGRFHLYEGYSAKEITFPVRVMASLGVQYLCISSAAGGLNPGFDPGDLMVVEDHINLSGDNPLVGPNLEGFGPRFPDMSRAYDPPLIRLVIDKATELKIRLRSGVYVGILGPSLETRAETRFLRMIGADAVGMSTVLETIAAIHSGLKVMAIVAITNVNLPDCMEETSIEKVVSVAQGAGPVLGRLWESIIEALPF